MTKRHAMIDDDVKNIDNKIDDKAPECLSVILSSSPCDHVKQVEASAMELIQELLQENDDILTLAKHL